MNAPINEQLLSRKFDFSTLWRAFKSAEAEDDFYRYWLAVQCSLIKGVNRGILVAREGQGDALKPVAKWPEDVEISQELTEIVEHVVEEGCGLVLPLDGWKSGNMVEQGYVIAFPSVVDGEVRGVAAIEFFTHCEQDLATVMPELQWGVGWLELWLLRHTTQDDRHTIERLRSAVDFLARVLSEEHFAGAGMTFVTELATEMDCDRVSLGVMGRNGHIRVQSVSHSASFGRKMNLTRAVELAMDEAVLQRQELIYPAPEDEQAVVLRQHKELVRESYAESLLTVPLYVSDHYFGALTLERREQKNFSRREVEFCRSVAALAAPALEAKRFNDRLLLWKMFDSAGTQLTRLFGPRYLGRKLAVLLLAVVAAFCFLAEGEYRLTADVTLEGLVRRVVVAPLNGYIQEAAVRAGDLVEKDGVICRLDDRDLRIERLNWLSKGRQLQAQYQEAMAKHDSGQMNILQAQVDQAKGELALVDGNLERIAIKAPFSGFVLSGDLSQRLGGPVEQGEVLFEVAPLDAYRMILQVDERRIADVRQGQSGRLILSSLPNKSFAFVVEKITAIATAEEGRNYFRVEAKLLDNSQQLRPGMEGIGKISIDRRRLAGIWTRNLVEWLHLWLWRWWP